jgi:hypothetical protein
MQQDGRCLENNTGEEVGYSILPDNKPQTSNNLLQAQLISLTFTNAYFPNFTASKIAYAFKRKQTIPGF